MNSGRPAISASAERKSSSLALGGVSSGTPSASASTCTGDGVSSVQHAIDAFDKIMEHAALDDVFAFLDDAVGPQEEDSGLPKWLDDMLKPGVGAGVFTTLKLSLVGLVLTLCALLVYIEDEVCAR